ncbi:ABC transporter, ATP-binding protein [Teladorsagia circumcincta]|uniref:ABC transporter, ATP-binding protein n=1 Tax=Teladorsagia circumcincta TaxID=45464 RepID=A0A2G9UK56_TELCI|nr:ABC transporter, ATP-binding protein [Teladorsagia circumcincta]
MYCKKVSKEKASGVVTHTTKVKSAKSEGFELEKNEEWIDRAVTLNNVYKYWHSTKELAIGNISFSAYYGQVTALLGHDGSGKTTIMKLISGDIDPTRGFINVLNLMKTRGKALRGKEVGYCSQQITLFENLTVLEHLWFFYCLKTGTSDWREDAMSTAKDVGLGEFLKKKSSDLSETRKRLLTLAIALVGGSPVVLMDEPLKGLDAQTKNLFRNILEVKKEERHIALLRGLERKRSKLGITEYYISMCTLMDVYRRIEIYNLKEENEHEQIEEEPKGKHGMHYNDLPLNSKTTKVTVPIILVIFTIISIDQRSTPHTKSMFNTFLKTTSLVSNAVGTVTWRELVITGGVSVIPSFIRYNQHDLIKSMKHFDPLKSDEETSSDEHVCPNFDTGY